MALADHLRELRTRFLVSVVAIALGCIPGWLLYPYLLTKLSEPITAAGGQLNFQGLMTGFSVQLLVALMVGIIVASPVWVYEVWAFIVPGLTKKEKWTALAFLSSAVPLFLAGCGIAYLILDKAVAIMLSFVPAEQLTIMPAADYLVFVTRFIVAFGLAFLLPVLLVALNMVGVLPAALMLRGWRIAVIVIFVLSALITPTPDAVTMFFLAVPMVVLYFAACGVAFGLDRRREKQRPEWADLADDEASPL